MTTNVRLLKLHRMIRDPFFWILLASYWWWFYCWFSVIKDFPGHVGMVLKIFIASCGAYLVTKESIRKK